MITRAIVPHDRWDLAPPERPMDAIHMYTIGSFIRKGDNKPTIVASDGAGGKANIPQALRKVGAGFATTSAQLSKEG